MQIGIPREIKNGEHRVALTPQGAALLVQRGHHVVIEAGAGADSGFDDALYLQAGAEVATAEQAWVCDMVIKVKEPLPAEYPLLRPELLLFTYLHLAACPALQQQLLSSRVTAIGYETVQEADGSLPLLAPMSQIAGRVAVSMGMHWLMRENGSGFPGMGRLCGGIDGVEAVQVLVIGGGHVGQHAAQLATGMGAQPRIVEACEARRVVLQQRYPHIPILTPDEITPVLTSCQLLIGAALIPGAKAPRLLRREQIASMQPGSVFVDVAIDQGGISETSRVTSYDAPLYEQDGVLHCCLPNLPAAVAVSSTQALTHATLPYVLALADDGLDAACERMPTLRRGINLRHGSILHPALQAPD